MGWTAAGAGNSLAAVITLSSPPRLGEPTAAVRISYLTGEQVDCSASGSATDWLGARERGLRWARGLVPGRPATLGCPVLDLLVRGGEHYLGTLAIRHELTPALLVDGGHIGYHVSPAWRRQGHATRMLAAVLGELVTHYNEHRPDQGRDQRPPGAMDTTPAVLDLASAQIRHRKILNEAFRVTAVDVG